MANPPMAHVDQELNQYPAGTPPYFDDFGIYELETANAVVREKSSSAPGYANVSTGLHSAEYMARKVESFSHAAGTAARPPMRSRGSCISARQSRTNAPSRTMAPQPSPASVGVPMRGRR